MENNSFYELLVNKLKNIVDVEVKFAQDTEAEIKRLLTDGKTYEGSDFIFKDDNYSNECHMNIAKLYKKENIKIISGYAIDLEGGEWVQHSWGITRNNDLIETTFSFDIYFGYELNSSESEEFYDENY